MTSTILDSRELEDEIQALADDPDLDEDDATRLAALRSLRDELEGYGWEHGIALIPEDEFEEYARQLAEDIGSITGNEGWPMRCIDWEQAASELATDYSLVTFDGIDYYWREA